MQARSEIATWRQDYNEVRPHSSLGRIPPAEFAQRHRAKNLHRPPGLDQNVTHVMSLRPGDEGPAGELRPVVGSHRRWIAPEDRRPVQQPRHVLTGDAIVHGDVHALVREVVGHGQALDAPAVGQTVGNEVHAPHLVDTASYRKWHALAGCAPHLLALTNRQLRLAVQPIDPLVVHAWELPTQQVMNAAIAKTPPHLRDLDDLGAELLRGLINHGRVAIAVSREPHQAARAALGQMMLGNHLGRRCALDLRG